MPEKICSSSIHFKMNFVLQHVNLHGEGTHGAVAKATGRGAPAQGSNLGVAPN